MAQEARIEVEMTEEEIEGETPSAGRRSQSALSRMFDSLSAWLTMAVLVLAPLLVTAGTFIPTEFAKHAFFIIVLSLAGILWIAARITGESVTLPKSGIVAGLGIMLLLLLPALFFSGSFSVSFAGLGGETGTMLSVLAYALAAFLVMSHIRSPRQIVSYLSYLLGLGVVVFILQLISIFAGPFSWLGNAGSIIGSWNDTAVFYGLVLSIALSFLMFVGVVGRYRLLAWIAGIAALAGLVVSNFPGAWNALAILSVLIFLAGIVRNRRSEDGVALPWWRIAVLPVAVFVISLIFIVLGPTDRAIGSRIVAFQLDHGINSLNARPSWSSTLVILGTAYDERPAIGVGLNRFAETWVANRPDNVNISPFWNVAFTAGVGYIPTFAITAGILGLLGWLIFLLSAAVSGIRQSFSQGAHHEAHAALLMLFITTIYLFIVQFGYVTESFMVGLSFVFIGFLVATGVIAGTVSERTMHLFADARRRFVSLVVFVLLLIVFAGMGYTSAMRVSAFNAFRKGTDAFSRGDFDAAQASFVAATVRAPVDAYWRALTDAETQRIRVLLSDASLSPDDLRARFQELLTGAISAGEAARDYNPANYLNHLSLGRLYTALIPLQFSDAYDLAVSSYRAAQDRAPRYPQVFFERGRLERIAGNEDAARELFGTALDLKPNYTEALFELSLLELAGDNLDGAIVRAQNAATLSPTNEGVFFQLGFLLYQKGSYRDAGVALERAVVLNNDYANALYFLGLVYDELDFTQEAIAAFERIERLNPDNDRVQAILRNLRAGLPALRGIDRATELEELPIDEEA